MHNVETLRERRVVGTVCLHEYSILPVKLKPTFLILQKQRNLSSIGRRHRQLLALEVVTEDFWGAEKFALAKHSLAPLFVRVDVSLLIYKGTLEEKVKLFGVVV